MGEDPGAVRAPALDDGAGARSPEDPQQLRVEIERTRQELGETVAALAEKTDVKARAKEKVAEVRQNVNDKRTELMDRARSSSPSSGSQDGTSPAEQVRQKAEENPVPTAALAAFVGGFIFGRLSKRR